MLRRIDSRYIHRMNSQDLDDLTNSCRDTEQVNKRGGFIFPGKIIKKNYYSSSQMPTINQEPITQEDDVNNHPPH